MTTRERAGIVFEEDGHPTVATLESMYGDGNPGEQSQATLQRVRHHVAECGECQHSIDMHRKKSRETENIPLVP